MTELVQNTGPRTGPKYLRFGFRSGLVDGEDDRVVKATTTAASLKAEQESGYINKTQPMATLNEPSPQGSGSGSRPRRHVTTLGDTYAQTRVLALEQFKTAQDLVIKRLKRKVKILENKQRARTLGMKLFKIGTSKKKTLDGEFSSTGDAVNAASVIPDVSVVGPSTSAAGPTTSTTEDIFKDEMTTMADTLMASRRTRPRTTSVVIHDVEEEPRRATPLPTVQSQDKGKGKIMKPEPISKNPIKAQIQRDAEIAQRLFEEEQAQFEREQRTAREKAAEQKGKDVALIEQVEDVQARIDANALLAERLKQKEREQFTVDEQARKLIDLIAQRKRFFAAQRAEQTRNKSPTKAQLRNKMTTYLKHIGKYTYNQLKSKSFEEIQMLYEKKQKWINDFVPMDSEEVNDS
nr:hypothetical protein [Tanacetum cinerariifolium]